MAMLPALNVQSLSSTALLNEHEPHGHGHSVRQLRQSEATLTTKEARACRLVNM